jgi:hypothetical protein
VRSFTISIQLSQIQGRARPGIVHRLDVGTSGLMVVAKTERVLIWRLPRNWRAEWFSSSLSRVGSWPHLSEMREN